MDKDLSNLLRSALLMALGGLLGVLLLALGLDYLWLDKSLMESLRHWSPSALGFTTGVLVAFLIGGLYRRWRAGK